MQQAHPEGGKLLGGCLATAPAPPPLSAFSWSLKLLVSLPVGSELEQLRSRLENTDQELQVCESLHHKSSYCDYIDLKIIFYITDICQFWYIAALFSL